MQAAEIEKSTCSFPSLYSIQFSNFSSGDEENPSITAFTSRSEFVTVVSIATDQ